MKTIERQYKNRTVTTVVYDKDEAPEINELYGEDSTFNIFEILKGFGATRVELTCIEKGVYELNATLKYPQE